MGTNFSSKLSQASMENVIRGIDDSYVYIDDIGEFSNNWESQMQLLDDILRRLKDSELKINPLK